MTKQTPTQSFADRGGIAHVNVEVVRLSHVLSDNVHRSTVAIARLPSRGTRLHFPTLNYSPMQRLPSVRDPVAVHLNATVAGDREL